MNPNDYVKYSFLDQVGKYVAELGITDIGQLDNPKYNSVFERAVERIKTSVNNKPYTPKYDSPNTEILSFLASVTLLSLSNNMRLVKKFALYESKGIETSLKQDMKKDTTQKMKAGVNTILRNPLHLWFQTYMPLPMNHHL